VGSEIFCTRPDQPWGLPSLVYNWYQVFSGGEAARAWRWPPTPSSAEVKERVELYLYSPCGPSWPILGWPLPLNCLLDLRSQFYKIVFSMLHYKYQEIKTAF
jgi:hypothetical protein